MTEVRFYRLGWFALREGTTTPLELWEADWDGKGPRRTAVLPVAAQRRRNLARIGIVMFAALGLLSAVYWGWRMRSSEGPPVFRSGGARRSVAVMGFENLSGKPDVAWLSTALAEVLNAELAAGGKL